MRIVCRGHRFAVAPINLPGSERVCGLAISRRLLHECALTIGDQVLIEMEVAIGNEPTIPRDVADALSDAGASLEVLRPTERRLALAAIKEAGSSAARCERVAALVEACLTAGARQSIAGLQRAE